MIKLPPHWERVENGQHHFYQRFGLPSSLSRMTVARSHRVFSKITWWRGEVTLSFSDYQGQGLGAPTLSLAIEKAEAFLDFIADGFPTCSNGCHVCLTERIQGPIPGQTIQQWGRWLNLQGGDITFHGSTFCEASQERLPVGGRPIKMQPVPVVEARRPHLEMPEDMKLQEWDQ